MTSKTELERLLREMQLGAPAASARVEYLEEQFHLSLPAEYKRFLLLSDGAAGMIGPEEVHLFSVDEALDVNERFCSFAEGLFIFGSDGADEAYAFDPTDNWSVVMVPFSAMGRRDLLPMGRGLAGFFRNLERGERLRSS